VRVGAGGMAQGRRALPPVAAGPRGRDSPAGLKRTARAGGVQAARRSAAAVPEYQNGSPPARAGPRGTARRQHTPGAACRQK